MRNTEASAKASLLRRWDREGPDCEAYSPTETTCSLAVGPRSSRAWCEGRRHLSAHHLPSLTAQALKPKQPRPGLAGGLLWRPPRQLVWPCSDDEQSASWPDQKCLALYLVYFYWFLWVGLAHALVSSRAVFFDRHFSDRKSPPFLYEVAIENARSKNAARKSPKSDRIRPDLMRDRKRKTAFFDLDFSIRKIYIAFLRIR